MTAMARSTPPTFRARLMVAVALLSIGVLTAASVTIYLGVREALRANLDDALLSIAHTQVTAALHGDGGRIDLPEGNPTHLALSGGSGYEEFVQITDTAGRVVARTANLDGDLSLRPDPQRSREAARGNPSFGETRLAGAPYRTIHYPLTDRTGRHLVAVIAISQEPMRRSLRSLLGVILAALGFTGAAAAWASGRLARRLTQPLEQISAASRSVAGDNLGARIPAVSDDAELRSVTEMLNDMLARLELAFENERRFVADASHELRSPLANLRGTVEVALRRERSGPEYRETLTVALAEVERLTRLTTDLLTLSRADGGQLVASSSVCDLAGVVGRGIEACRERAMAGDVRIQLDSPGEILVPGSADNLRQVVDNILDNAVRHSPPGTTVAVQLSLDPGHVVMSVRDEGPGIAPEVLPRVFDRFFRADPARGRRSGGTGLGLAIARAIAEAHGGTISAVCEPGQGAEFRLRLPLAATQTRPVV